MNAFVYLFISLRFPVATFLPSVLVGVPVLRLTVAGDRRVAVEDAVAGEIYSAEQELDFYKINCYFF